MYKISSYKISKYNSSIVQRHKNKGKVLKDNRSKRQHKHTTDVIQREKVKLLDDKEIETDDITLTQLREYLKEVKEEVYKSSGYFGNPKAERLYHQLSRIESERRHIQEPHNEAMFSFMHAVKSKKYKKAIKGVNKRYFNNSKEFTLNSQYDKTRPTRHATTRGKSKSTSISFDTPYMDKIADGDEEDFAKFVSTFRHERRHGEQRRDKKYKSKTTKSEREFEAYSMELEPEKGLPLLYGPHRKKTIKKMRRNYKALRKEHKKTSSKHKNQYKIKYRKLKKYTPDLTKSKASIYEGPK